MVGHLVTRVDTVLKYGISNVNMRDGTNMTSVHKVEMGKQDSNTILVRGRRGGGVLS